MSGACTNRSTPPTVPAPRLALTSIRSSTRIFPIRRSSRRPTAFITPMRPRPCATANGSTSRSRGRPTSSTGSISAMRFRKSRTGRGKRRTSGRPTCSTTAIATSCIIRRRPTFATIPSAAIAWRSRRPTSPAGPFVDMGMPLLLGVGFEYIDPMAFDDPATGKRLLYWGSGFQPIKVQELGDDRMSFAPGSEPIDLIWPNPVEGAFPAAGRSRLGDPSRRLLLSVLLRRQLLRARCRIWRDGRPLARARPGRSKRSRRRAACRTA